MRTEVKRNCALPEASDGYAYTGWSADDHRLFTADRSGVVTLWDAWTGKMVQQFDSGGALEWDPAWTKNGLRLITLGENGSLQIWDTRTGKLVRNVAGVAWYDLSSDGKWLLASCRRRWPTTVWDITTGEQLLTDKRIDTAAIDARGTRDGQQ